jgi:hypothetical protein
MTYTVSLSDKAIFELREDGANTKVEYADRFEYSRQALLIRM